MDFEREMGGDVSAVMYAAIESMTNRDFVPCFITQPPKEWDEELEARKDLCR
jgi:hypothetical protein